MAVQFGSMGKKALLGPESALSFLFYFQIIFTYFSTHFLVILIAINVFPEPRSLC
jgi:hypothetical protein